VGFGSTVVVYDIIKSVELEYRLVTSEESDAKQGMVSTSSPVGRGLLNRRVGEEIKIQVPGGALEYEVVRIVTIHGETLEA
jgi:transcription elongation factor GreA